MLVEHGVRGITVEGIAARSGVAKTTIYRHWPSKAELVLAIVAEQAFSFPPSTGACAEDDLRQNLRALSRALAEPRQRILLLGVLELSARDASLASAHAAFLAAGADHLLSVMTRLEEAGRLPAPADPRLTLALLVSPVIVKALFLGESVSDEEIELLMQRALGTQPRG